MEHSLKGKITFEDLQIIETLDTTHGGATKVYLARHPEFEELVVCKAIKKSAFQDAKSIQHVKNQKNALLHFTSLKNPHINHIVSTFQDAENIYLLLKAVSGLPLHKLLQMTEQNRLSPKFSKLVLYQIGRILEDFHKEGWIYRDIKASNFMVDQKGFVVMIDLGKAKKIERERTYTICGTTHAIPPQVLKMEKLLNQQADKKEKVRQGYSYEFDYYSYGVLVYELLVGVSPFGYGNSNKQIKQEIQSGISKEKLQQLRKIDSEATKLVQGLLRTQPDKRLGMKGGFKEILQHGFFRSSQNQEEELSKIQLIYDGKLLLAQNDDQGLGCEKELSEIRDFGIQRQKYEQISVDDPFFKFG